MAEARGGRGDMPAWPGVRRAAEGRCAISVLAHTFTHGVHSFGWVRSVPPKWLVVDLACILRTPRASRPSQLCRYVCHDSAKKCPVLCGFSGFRVSSQPIAPSGYLVAVPCRLWMRWTRCADESQEAAVLLTHCASRVEDISVDPHAYTCTPPWSRPSFHGSECHIAPIPMLAEGATFTALFGSPPKMHMRCSGLARSHPLLAVCARPSTHPNLTPCLGSPGTSRDNPAV